VDVHYDKADHPLVRRLNSISELDAEELAAIAVLPMHVRELSKDEVIVREGDTPSRSCVLLEGFMYRSKAASGGARQIFSFHARGEIADLQSLYLETMDHDVAALSPARVGFVQHDDLRALCARWPRVAGTLWRETLIDGAVFREWMLGIGRRSATERIGHLFCEMFVRLEVAGFADGWTVPLPITQEQLADALGLSTVHVNRSLQILRSNGYVSFGGGTLTIIDWGRLSSFCDFRPLYLHQRRSTLRT
jgi:CRP-like cAMP-binding protein